MSIHKSVKSQASIVNSSRHNRSKFLILLYLRSCADTRAREGIPTLELAIMTGLPLLSVRSLVRRYDNWRYVSLSGSPLVCRITGRGRHFLTRMQAGFPELCKSWCAELAKWLNKSDADTLQFISTHEIIDFLIDSGLYKRSDKRYYVPVSKRQHTQSTVTPVKSWRCGRCQSVFQAPVNVHFECPSCGASLYTSSDDGDVKHSAESQLYKNRGV